MAALTGDRNTEWTRLDGEVTPSPGMKANTTIFNGAGVCVDANGFLVPASDTANLRTQGVAREKGVSTGLADGALRLRVGYGVFAFKTTGVNAITVADIGKLAYWLDDQTVVRAAGATNDVPAGTVEGIDPDTGEVRLDMTRIPTVA